MKTGIYFDSGPMNQIPKFCPHCGHEFTFKSYEARADYFSQNSHSCDCGSHFIFIVEKYNLSENVRKELNHYRKGAGEDE